jgi:hypothetical protein
LALRNAVLSVIQSRKAVKTKWRKWRTLTFAATQN